jgi:thioredoxin reductase (NADPH)
MLHSIIRSMEDRVHFCEIDITVDPEVAAAGITGSPTVQVFKDRSLVKEFRGVRMKSEYRQAIEGCLVINRE